MITVFSLGNAWKRSQLEIASEISYKILCERLIPYQKEKLPDNVTFKVATGKKAYDLIRLYESGEYFFSQKIIDILSQFVDMSNKCYPINIEGVDKQYYVIYNLYAYPYLNKEKAMFEEEPPFFCGTKINTPLFSVTSTNRFVVTEDIKNTLIKNKISNIDFSKEFLCSEEEYKDWQKYNRKKMENNK